MISKYYLFRRLMDLIADDFDVVDADMNTWNGGMTLKGEYAGETITIEVTIKNKEENEDA